MLAKLSELAQIPLPRPISLAAFLFSISHYSPFASKIALLRFQ